MTIPTNVVSDIASSTSGTFMSLFPIIMILLGIGIAFYVIKNIYNLFPHR